jgi:hypothetical protein
MAKTLTKKIANGLTSVRNVRGLTYDDQLYEEFMTTDLAEVIEVVGVSDRILSKYGAVNKEINRRIKYNRSKKLMLE